MGRITAFLLQEELKIDPIPDTDVPFFDIKHADFAWYISQCFGSRQNFRQIFILYSKMLKFTEKLAKNLAKCFSKLWPSR